MAEFYELRGGVIINLDAIVRIHPAWGSYRVDFSNGLHHTMGEEEGEAVRQLLVGRNKPPKRKTATQKTE